MCKGVVSPVRRLVFPASSAAGNRTSWQWNANTINKPYWLPYAADVVECIERAFQTSMRRPLNLSSQFPDFDYSVHFTTMTQVSVMFYVKLIAQWSSGESIRF